MAWRLCFAACVAAAVAAVLLGIGERSRRHTRLADEQWIVRANAAAACAGDRAAAPLLVALLDDPNPRVRMNALWALHRLTGLPWASQPEACRTWWEENGVPWMRGRNVPAMPADPAPDPGAPALELTAIARPGGVVAVVLRSGLPQRARIAPAPLEQYSAFLYGRDGRVVRVLDDEEPASAAVEVRVTDAAGGAIARYYWRLSGEEISPDAPLGQEYGTPELPSGPCAAEVLLGGGALIPGEAAPGARAARFPSRRVVLVLER